MESRDQDQDEATFPVCLHLGSQVGSWQVTLIKAGMSTTIDFGGALNLTRWLEEFYFRQGAPHPGLR